jgi:hypothetical protein
VPAASNSGAASPIAAHSRLVLIAARATIRAARSRRSGGYLLEELPDKTAVCSLPRLPGVLMLSAFKPTKCWLSGSIIV